MRQASAPLGDLCDISIGRTPPRAEPKYWGPGHPWLSISNMEQGPDITRTSETITDAAVVECGCRLVEPGTLLFSFKLSIGKVGFARIPLYTNEAIAALRIRQKGRVEPRYLYHVLRSGDWASGADHAVKGATLNKAKLAQLRIPLVDLEEQRRIAAILDTADSIDKGRQRAMALQAEFLQSAFLEAFGDPVSSPRGLAKRRLGELGEVQGGLQVSASRAGLPLEVPYLRVANVFRDKLDLQEVKTMRLTSTELARTRLAIGDLLIVEGHGNPAQIGRCTVWPGSVDPCVHQNHLIRVRLDRSIAEPAFVSAFLNSAGGRQQMLRFGKTTSGLSTISTSNVKSCTVPLPPLEMQKKYSDLVTRTNGLAARMELAAATTAHLAGVLGRLALDGVLVPEAVVQEENDC